jgi:hypothetical protein
LCSAVKALLGGVRKAPGRDARGPDISLGVFTDSCLDGSKIEGVSLTGGGCPAGGLPIWPRTLIVRQTNAKADAPNLDADVENLMNLS